MGAIKPDRAGKIDIIVSLDAQTLAEGLRAFGKPVTACFSIAEGVRLAKARAGAHGAVLCCGSLYLLGDVLTALET